MRTQPIFSHCKRRHEPSFPKVSTTFPVLILRTSTFSLATALAHLLLLNGNKDHSTMAETPTNGKGHSLQDPLVVIKETKLVIETPKGVSEVPETAKSPGVGRIKEPPVCKNQELKNESMSTEELSKLCFPQCSDNTVSTTMSTNSTTSSACSVSSKESDHAQSQLNAKVMTQTSSRQGRETQRWMTDPATHQRIRLVTGCVPILKDGRILFVSSSRKAEWILPKGGWELDEAMEESAVRETYEEAGVLGTLGTKMTEIQYETRKSKKRRLELEEMLKRQKDAAETGSSSGASDGASEPEEEQGTVEKRSKGELPSQVAVPAVTVPKVPHGTMSDDVVNRIRASRNFATMGCDETSSAASDASSTYSLVRMTLFPLYVTEVKDDWPESGRFRKAMEIDDAIEMMKSRSEFHAVLKEVKEKGLHKVVPGHKGIQ